MLASVAAQLRYLLELAEYRVDGSRIGEIILGLPAVRGIEALDGALAGELDAIEADVGARVAALASWDVTAAAFPVSLSLYRRQSRAIGERVGATGEKAE